MLCYLLLQRSMWTFHIWSPVRAMSRTVRRMSVAVPWSFLGNLLLVRWFLFLLFGEGTIARHVLPVHRGKGLTCLCQSFSCGYVVCSGLFLAGISWSVREAKEVEGNLVGDYSLHLLCLKSASLLILMSVFVLDNLVFILGCCFLLPSFTS